MKLVDEEREKIRMEVKENVRILFDRIYNIKKIRRKRKVKEWLKNHIN